MEENSGNSNGHLFLFSERWKLKTRLHLYVIRYYSSPLNCLNNMENGKKDMLLYSCIPLTNRVRGPCCKLRVSVTYSTGRENQVSKRYVRILIKMKANIVAAPQFLLKPTLFTNIHIVNFWQIINKSTVVFYTVIDKKMTS